MTPVAGNGGKCTVGGIDLVVTKWTRQPANRKGDTTASDTAGWQRKQGVLKGWQGTVEVIWDNDQVPSAAGVQQNAIVTLRLYLGASGKYATGPAILDGPAEQVDNTNDVVRYSVNWESTGAWVEAA